MPGASKTNMPNERTKIAPNYNFVDFVLKMEYLCNLEENSNLEEKHNCEGSL